MKKILLLMTMVLLLAAEGFSQAPGILNYQGVARNSVGNVLVNQNISLRLTIRNLTAAGAVVYQESRAVTTNPFGLFNVQLGSPGASGVTGTIPGVNWAVGAKFIQVEIDPNGGSSFINIGTAQLASVPYSLFATTAGDLILPFNKTQNDNGTLFKITNSGTNSGSTALEGLTNSTAGSANAIIGTVTSASPGGFSAGVRGINNGTGGSGIGVYGSQAGSGWGVYGNTPSGIGVYGNTTSGIGLSGNSTSGAGVVGQSNTGVAGIFTITNAASTADALQANTTGTGWAATITSSNATPRALRTTGGLRFTGINEANNRILTSDASGNATWQNPAVVGIVTGSGTLDRVPKWTPNGTNLGDSRIEDRAGTLPIGINTPSGYTYTSIQPGLEMTNSTALLQTRIVLRDESDGGDVQGFMDARTSPTATVSALQVGTLTNHPITFFGNGAVMGRWSSAGNLGIGTATGVDPTARLQLDNATTTVGGFLLNNTNAANTNRAASIFSANTSVTTYGNSALYAQRGTGSLANTFLYNGIATSITGVAASTQGFGMQGTSETGYGVVGLSTSGVAVHGISINAGNAGLFVNNNAASTDAVVAVNNVSTAANAFGVHSIVTSTAPGGFSSAIRGQNNGTGGLGIGVYGSQAGSGWGVFGTTPNGLGVYGNSSASGFGVYGQSNTGTGIYGISSTGESGRFEITNNANTNHALNVSTNGLGRGVNVVATSASPNAVRSLLGTVPVVSIGNQTSIYGESNVGIGVVGVSSAQNGVVGLNNGAFGGTVGINTGSGNGLWGVATSTGRAGFFESTNSANTTTAIDVDNAGLGRGIDIQMLNALNNNSAININHSGSGRAVFATATGGTGVEGTTNSISAGGIIGRNFAGGEAIIGFIGANSVSAAGAVVGRNDGIGYGLHGFNTSTGIGVYGRSGVSGGTGVAGRFENVNAGNSTNTLEVSTNGTGRGIDVQQTSNTNTNSGINVTQAGSGRGVFATSASGTGVEGITSSISAAGVIGRNQIGGEAIVGFTTANGAAAGAVVGRNDGDYAGVHGFSTHANGIGVIARVTNATATNSVALLANNAQGGASGNIAIFQNTNVNVARIDRTGRGFFNNGTQVGGADIAEFFEVEGGRNEYETGDVLVISQSSDRKVEKSSTPYSTLVSGVFATKPGVLLTERNAEENQLDDMVPMGVIGVIPTKVCLEGGTIKRGDLLVTSSISGVAMKADPDKVKVGQVLGKALQDYNQNTVGKINVLVSVK